MLGVGVLPLVYFSPDSQKTWLHITYKLVSNSRCPRCCVSVFVFRWVTIDIHQSPLLSFFPASLLLFTFFWTSSTHGKTTLWWILHIYPCCCRAEIKKKSILSSPEVTISFLKAKKCQEGWRWCWMYGHPQSVSRWFITKRFQCFCPSLTLNRWR